MCCLISDTHTRRAIELIMLFIQDVRVSGAQRIEEVKTSFATRIDASVQSAMWKAEREATLRKTTSATEKVEQPMAMVLGPTTRRDEPGKWRPIPPPQLVPRDFHSARAVTKDNAFAGKSRCPSPHRSSLLGTTSAHRASLISPCPLQSSSSLHPTAKPSTSGNSQRNIAPASSSITGCGESLIDTSAQGSCQSTDLPMWLQISASMPTRNK